jgi:hypothetical protein
MGAEADYTLRAKRPGQMRRWIIAADRGHPSTLATRTHRFSDSMGAQTP